MMMLPKTIQSAPNPVSSCWEELSHYLLSFWLQYISLDTIEPETTASTDTDCRRDKDVQHVKGEHFKKKP